MQFETTIVSTGGKRLKRPPRATCQVKVVLQLQTCFVEAEFTRIPAQALTGRAQTLTLGSQPGINLWIQGETRMRSHKFLRLAHVSPGSRQVGAGQKSLADQGVQFR